MVDEQALVSKNGVKIPTQVDTICLHGYGETAVQIAQTLRDNLSKSGVDIQPF